MDWSLTVITIPYLLSPVAAGVPLGFANVLGISTDFQCYFALTSVAAQGMAFVLIFENRYFLIFARNTLWRYIRVVFIIINYCAVFCVFLPLLTMIPEQTEARKAVLKILPDLPEALDVKLIFVLSTDISYILISAVFMESFLSTEAAIFVVLLWTNFKLTRSAQHSFKTLKLQKKFLLAMYIQAAVMFFNLVIPVSYFIFSTVSKLHNQTANNLSILQFVIAEKTTMLPTVAIPAMSIQRRGVDEDVGARSTNIGA
ncbi:hypothetical protein GCK72_019577 [Caenorhabditis remanei]|uniref:Serpentine Receptor, class H n=1 Tax=Caenorhabditis remanei TaxID=31234 RepID=A0A6A5GEI1_CAERE|nr:hypothetical protein GCK72_019577 [Caenorhabditis remanei]KAF1753021.1 hypothetical protein GCK72_019577 [Caenorhabditis remanei]